MMYNVAMSPPPPADRRALKRALTLPLVVLYGLGVTIGAGIYVLVGAAAAEAGVYAPVSFLIAAAGVAFTALSYAELATRYPVSAGEAGLLVERLSFDAWGKRREAGWSSKTGAARAAGAGGQGDALARADRVSPRPFALHD